jgi:hypothetical protein
MDRDWPNELTDFEAFLQKMGLDYQWSEAQSRYGYRMVQWGDADIAVRATLDRIYWSIAVADVAPGHDRWYDVRLLRELLLGPSDDGMSLRDEVHFVESTWPTIVDSFTSERRDDTHATLSLLAQERARRRFPYLYGKMSWRLWLTRAWYSFIRKLQW